MVIKPDAKLYNLHRTPCAQFFVLARNGILLQNARMEKRNSKPPAKTDFSKYANASFRLPDALNDVIKAIKRKRRGAVTTGSICKNFLVENIDLLRVRYGITSTAN